MGRDNERKDVLPTKDKEIKGRETLIVAFLKEVLPSKAKEMRLRK